MRKKKTVIAIDRRAKIIIGIIGVLGLFAFSLFRGGTITGFTTADSSEPEFIRKLVISAHRVEIAEYNSGGQNQNYFRVWAKIFNPNDQARRLLDVRLVDEFGNEHTPSTAIATRVGRSEQVIGDISEIGPQTTKEGYLVWPELETTKVRLVFTAEDYEESFGVSR